MVNFHPSRTVGKCTSRRLFRYSGFRNNAYAKLLGGVNKVYCGNVKVANREY